MIKPRKLKSGDTIGIVSPCFALEKAAARQAESFFTDKGFSVKFGENAFATTHGYAASPRERAADFEQMIRDDAVKMILFEGGEVGNELLPLLPYGLIAQKPKIICSYSDGTSILNSIVARAGLCVYYGQSPDCFSGADSYNWGRFTSAFVDNKEREFVSNGPWETLRGGKTRGILTGGYMLNYALLMGGGYFRPLPGKKHLLFLEESHYFAPVAAVSRYLSHIAQSGFLSQVGGLLFGHYAPKPEQQEGLREILTRFGVKYDIPVVKCDDFGHGENHAILPIGIEAELDADGKTLTFLESLCND